MSFFENIFRAISRRQMTDYERYLSQAKDLYDLEQREKAWSRGKRI